VIIGIIVLYGLSVMEEERSRDVKGERVIRLNSSEKPVSTEMLNAETNYYSLNGCTSEIGPGYRKYVCPTEVKAFDYKLPTVGG
jgi:hypothetical protein